MSQPTRTLALAVIASALMAGVAGAAAAADEKLVEASVDVNVSDLNLANTTDVRTLLGRIESAAQQACRKAWRQIGRPSRPNYRNCIDRAIDDSVEHSNNAALIAARRESMPTFASR